MLDYGLSDEQKMILELIKKIGEEKIKPVREKLDETGEFPWEIMKAFAAADLCGLYIPEELGGFGQSVFNFCLATEEVSRYCGGVGVTFAASALGSTPILLFGSDEQKKKYMPDIAAGKKLANIAVWVKDGSFLESHDILHVVCNASFSSEPWSIS